MWLLFLQRLESCKVCFCPKPFVTMDLPDDSQWDETTCDLAVCQHPQCWATIRRIERGHPRILGSPCKTSLDANGELASPCLLPYKIFELFLFGSLLTCYMFSLVCFLRETPSAHHCKHLRFLLPGQETCSSSFIRIYLH